MRRSFYHLTREDREVILEGIVESAPLADIARTLGKSSSSISREVKRNRLSAGRQTVKRKNICVQYKTCTKSKSCRHVCRKVRCASCLSVNCNDHCIDFVEEVCKRTSRFPYVCNGCGNKRICGLPRYLYRPGVADAKTKRLRSVSRQGITLSQEELVALNEVVSPLLKNNKQSVEVICSTNPDVIPVSPQTLRRYIDAGHTSAIRLDLLQAPSRKVRKKRKSPVSKHLDGGRSFADFSALSAKEQDFAWEMDTLHGSRNDRSCLLTLICRHSLFLLMLKIARCDSECVVGALDYLEILCNEAEKDFEEIFGAILTDNGSEFSDIVGMETSSNHPLKRRTSIYFCDPYSSWQKPHIEGRHRLIRRVLPKGESIDKIGHDKVSLLASHINSYPVMSKGGKTPFELSEQLIPDSICAGNNVVRISARNVAITRSLFDR